MKTNNTVAKQIFGFINTLLFIALVFTKVVTANDNPSALAGHWSGRFQTPGPAGMLEITLIEKENAWSGEVKIEGPGHKIFTKPAQNIKVEGEKLTFMIELVGAEITFTGNLKDGKLTGELAVVEDGKTIGMGSWQMARAEK